MSFLESIPAGGEYCLTNAMRRIHSSTFLIIILSVVTCLLLSNDGLLYGPSQHFDSAWFWCCGKWTMQGLTPYVDFTDSKGLLLWLIYGIGYLLTPHSYFGVCIMLMISFSIAYGFTYKTIRLFYNRKLSFMGVVMMSFAYWNGWIVTETHAETFIFPIMACYIFILTKAIKERNKQVNYLWYAFTLGVGMMTALMIKWSFVIMLFGFVCSFAFLAFLRKQLVKFLLGGLAGCLIVAVPFLLWFVFDGNFTAFVNEYFVNTMESVSDTLQQSIRIYYGELKVSLTSAKVIFIIMALASYWVLKECSKFERILPCLSFLFAYAFAIHHDYFNYYLLPLLPSAVFIVLMVFHYLKKQFLLPVSCLILLCTFGLRYYKWHDNLIYFNHPNSTNASYERAASIFNQYDSPKLLNFGNEQGMGLYTNTQPACKYWSTQQNSLTEMNNLRLNTLKNGEADIVTHQPFVKIVCRKDIEAAGYKYEMNYGLTEIYTKIINN